MLVIESAMGLFDGIAAAPGRSGAAADLARRFGVPVLLVLDVSGQSQTAAAIARGFATHDPGVRDRRRGAEPGGERAARARWCATRSRALGLPVVGAVHRNPDMALPERHLGLVQAREHAALEAFIERLADVMAAAIDLDAVLALARSARGRAARARAALPPPPGSGWRWPRTRRSASSIPHLVRHWRGGRGPSCVPFSPLADEGPDAACDACWLPGGYPELHAGRLAAAAASRRRCGGSPRRGRCMANAAASWCSGGRSRMPTA